MPTWAVAVAVAGAAGVVFYVVSWVVAGALIDGFDPLRQAISETFAIGVAPAARRLLTLALLVTGILLVADGPALHRALPGEGLVGPVLVVVAGLGTVAVAFAPCSEPGCPGAATSTMDTVHFLAATIGYVGLMTAPIAFAVRVREPLPRFSRLSFLIGGVAVALFLLRFAGFASSFGGLQQRLFNTVADAWYVVAAVEVVRLKASLRP